MSSEVEEKKSWSEIDLAPYPFSAAVVFDEETYEALCERHNFKDRTWLSEDAYGDVSKYGGLAVVRFCDISKVEQHKRVGIFSHEATHVFQALCRQISESDPSDEFQAYTIQAITQWLFKEHECYLASTSSSSEQQPSQPSSEVESGTSPLSEVTSQSQEHWSPSSKESSSEAKTT